LAIPLLNTSSTVQNKRGDKGSPCLTPLLQLKKPCSLPLIEMESFADSKIA